MALAPFMASLSMKIGPSKTQYGFNHKTIGLWSCAGASQGNYMYAFPWLCMRSWYALFILLFHQSLIHSFIVHCPLFFINCIWSNIHELSYFPRKTSYEVLLPVLCGLLSSITKDPTLGIGKKFANTVIFYLMSPSLLRGFLNVCAMNLIPFYFNFLYCVQCILKR